MKVKLCSVILLLCAIFVQGQTLTTQIQNGKFKAEEVSLKQYVVPEWYRDAKLGIWSHWGPQSVPMSGDWYARRMYIEGTKAYKYHLEHYGHPSKVGYKDIVPLWKAEKWNPEELMDLYVKAGAKFFVSVGAHHDGFALWNSKYTRWNAVKIGPQKDIVGEWAAAARKRGLRFGVSEHFARAYNWMGAAHGSDREGKYQGVPYDGNNPEYSDLYFPPKIEDNGDAYPLNPPNWWKEQWYNEMQEIIQNYKPDLLYSDGGFPMGNVGKTLVADFYNQNMKLHNGKLEAVYTQKAVGNNIKWGEYIPGAGVRDEEQAIFPSIHEDPWQIDASIGNWFYDRNFKNKENGTMYYSPGRIIRLLIDVTSKNGCVMLNIVQHPDGTIDPEARTILSALATFMKHNAEGIHATRPWIKASEGALMTDSIYKINKIKYAENEIHFTRSKDKKALYAFGFSWPQQNTAKIKSLGKEIGKITSVTLLGSKKKIKWQQTAEGLNVELPQAKPSEYVYGLKIMGSLTMPTKEQ